MSIFGWLVLGHLIGDWMFQTDWMARSKRGRLWSVECVMHCSIYTATVTLTAWFGSRGAMSAVQLGLLFGIVLISHWLIDGLDLAGRWGQLVNQTRIDYVRIVVDQTMHLIVLAAAAEFLLS